MEKTETSIKKVTPAVIPVLPQQEHLLDKSSDYIAVNIPTHSVEAKGSVVISMAMSDIPTLDFDRQAKNKINIFYYTQATPEHMDASKGKLAKIFDYAKTTNPVDWVGDFRNKKDEWIDNVFSLDE